MKKNITLLSSLLLFVFSVSAQSLYTKTGSDLTWEQIKKQKEIPKDIWGGLTGSKIDVNQDHPLISSSPYANRKIQEGTAIHTIANPTIQKSNFHKWTRWYQEDGNTQVFRMFKGEINVGNDIYYKPRVEAELKSHSKGSKIDNGAEWVEWSGTYTFVEPVQSNIFQIWSNKDVVLMLSMKNNGLVQLNPRDQSGFKTILGNGKGKSVHIRVRDYAYKYEVYVDGEYFYGRNYTSPGDRVAHFRWGIYASRLKGDYGGVPQDGMMFVTGAQRRFSNDEVIDTPVAIGPEGYKYSVAEAGTVAISDIAYDVAYGQDGDYVYLEKQTADVTCTNAVFGSDPKPGVKKYCFIKESKAPYSGSPLTIPGTLEAEYYDYGGQGVSYNDTDAENKGAEFSNFRTNDGVDIGQGTTGKGIGWSADGEWTEYTVNVKSTGEYKFNFVVASKNGGGKLGVDLDGTALLAGVGVPQTNDWDDYTSFIETVSLEEGEHILRLKIEKSGFNLDKIEISSAVTTGLEDEASSLSVYPNPSEKGVFYLSEIVGYELYDTKGNKLLVHRAGQVDLSSQPKGVYILHVGSKQVKLVK